MLRCCTLPLYERPVNRHESQTRGNAATAQSAPGTEHRRAALRKDGGLCQRTAQTYQGKTMQVTRIAGGASGLSEFSDVEVICTSQSLDRQPLELSAAPESPAVRFVSLPAGFEARMHPIEEPRRVFVMNGTPELATPTGEIRQVGRGDVLWAEDTDTTSHTTCTVNGPADLVFTAIGEEELVGAATR